MTPAANEFAEIARRLAEIKAERMHAIAGESEAAQYTFPIAGVTALPEADCGNTANPIDGPYC